MTSVYFFLRNGEKRDKIIDIKNIFGSFQIIMFFAFVCSSWDRTAYQEISISTEPSGRSTILLPGGLLSRINSVYLFLSSHRRGLLKSGQVQKDYHNYSQPRQLQRPSFRDCLP